MMQLVDKIEVRQNLHIVARERGKVVARRDGHNIWVNLGREYLAGLISFASFTPDTPERDDRVKYMGFGIGGNRQRIAPVPAPVGTSYPGTNGQTDEDLTVTALERPVRLSGATTAYPGSAGDVWLGRVQVPVTHATFTEVTFRRLFTGVDLSYSSFLEVPLSEIGLFTSAADPGVFSNTLIAYDTFPTISKTTAVEVEVAWTIRF